MRMKLQAHAQEDIGEPQICENCRWPVLTDLWFANSAVFRREAIEGIVVGFDREDVQLRLQVHSESLLRVTVSTLAGESYPFGLPPPAMNLRSLRNRLAETADLDVTRIMLFVAGNEDALRDQYSLQGGATLFCVLDQRSFTGSWDCSVTTTAGEGGAIHSYQILLEEHADGQVTGSGVFAAQNGFEEHTFAIQGWATRCPGQGAPKMDLVYRMAWSGRGGHSDISCTLDSPDGLRFQGLVTDGGACGATVSAVTA